MENANIKTKKYRNYFSKEPVENTDHSCFKTPITIIGLFHLFAGAVTHNSLDIK